MHPEFDLSDPSSARTPACGPPARDPLSHRAGGGREPAVVQAAGSAPGVVRRLPAARAPAAERARAERGDAA